MAKKLLTMLIAVIMVAALAMTSSASVVTDDVSPLDTGKEILYYLFWTCDDKLEADVKDLQEALSLTDQQMEELKELGLSERIQNQGLSETYSSNARASIEAFNIAIDEETVARNEVISEILGDQVDEFRAWIAEWWENECDYRMNTTISTYAGVNRLSNIWATQYVPNTSGAVEVALPDKYIKFANLGWNNTYSNPPYTVNVFNPSTNKSLLNVRVDEVGPWNENDNYWDSNRRGFSGLALGVPEAYAAFYNGYNNGKDEFGRTVTNPAGIDLSTAAAAQIGFPSTYSSGFVDVRYEYLP